MPITKHKKCPECGYQIPHHKDNCITLKENNLNLNLTPIHLFQLKNIETDEVSEVEEMMTDQEAEAFNIYRHEYNDLWRWHKIQ